MGSLLAIVALAVIVLVWVDSLRARERAVSSCAEACRRMDVQFLDQTVALSRIGIARGSGRALAIRRRYVFEFSTNGSDRRHGCAELLGPEVHYVQLDHPDGSTILDPAASAEPKLH